MKVFFIILVSSIAALRSSACSCAEVPSVEVEWARSDTIFVGRVVGLTLESRDSNGRLRSVRVCRFSDIEPFKGVVEGSQSLTVVTAFEYAACGYPFQLGARYVVYASSRAGELHTSICRRTTP